PASAVLAAPPVLEHYDDPPGVPARAAPNAVATGPIHFGRFTITQVNVTGSQANITGDAANEPSIAVDPNNHNRMAIGWRQFDNVSSNFRQAGYAYTTDGGATWTFPGKLEPGVFRSDPVLDQDAEGNFYYNSLRQTLESYVFRSSTGGASWGAPAYAYGGGKQWMSIDPTAGPGHRHIYQVGSTGPYDPTKLNRSNDGGVTFQAPTYDDSLFWGTLDVGTDGTMYLVGTENEGLDDYTLVRSFDVKNAVPTPTFTLSKFSLGGHIGDGLPQNPVGLSGQVWVAVDKATGPTAGWVYALCSVVRPGVDSLDVMFARSTDGGQSWSVPVRVNDDAPGASLQWFRTMSVAPNGRIDVVWNDTRHFA